ncbi:fatty acid desaturase [Microbulbifer epialgicus]|uniref:Fatty acid desaturase n=1 Tax=Microbulbifer epialgicus TaxID=393907 RepID=A0ABV4P4Y6_9GAMM
MNKKEWLKCQNSFTKNGKSWPTLTIILFDLLTMAAGLYLTKKGGFFSVVAVFFFVIVFLHAYLLLHEATHCSISHSKLLNGLCGHICGWLILIPFLTRQRSHLLHHVWAGHPENDPVNKAIIRYFSDMDDEKRVKTEKIWRSWLPLFTLSDRIRLWRETIQNKSIDSTGEKQQKNSKFIYCYGMSYIFIGVILFKFNFFLNFIMVYFVAIFILFFFEELVNMPHHARTPLLSFSDKALPYWHQCKIAHSCRRIPIWSYFFILNFNYHSAHHVFPKAPWYRLPLLHKKLLTYMPDLNDEQKKDEVTWALSNRKQSLCSIMKNYVDVADTLKPE